MRLSLITFIIVFTASTSATPRETTLRQGESVSFKQDDNSRLSSVMISWKSNVVPMPGVEKPLWKAVFDGDRQASLTTYIASEPSDRIDPRLYYKIEITTDDSLVTEARYFGNKRNFNPRDLHILKIAASHGNFHGISIDSGESLAVTDVLSGKSAMSLTALEKIRIATIDVCYKGQQPISGTIDVTDLHQKLASANDTIAGTFSYLDRQNDSRMAEPGGFYNLALMPSGDSYLIIYLGGAKVESETWSAGMIKGRLTPTPFKPNYNLEWIDSRHETMTGEQFAVLVNNTILELHFPLYETVMRFSRIPTQSVLQVECR